MVSEKEGSLLHKGGQPGFYYGYVVVLSAFIIYLTVWGIGATFGVFFKPMLTEFGWSRATLSGAYTLVSIMMGITGIITGRMTDRLGPRMIVTVGGFFLLVGFLLLPRITAIWQLYILYGIVIGIGLGTTIIPILSSISRWFVRRRGLMTGVIQAGAGIGGVVMAPLAGWLITDYGWRSSYITLGGITAVVTILATQFLRRDPAQMGLVLPEETGKVGKDSIVLATRGLSLREAINTRKFWMVWTIFFCFGYNRSATLVHIAPHVTDLGFSLAAGANVLSLISGASILGRLIFGRVSDSIGSRPTLIISFFLIAIVLCWASVAEQLWMLYLFAAVFGLGWGALAILRVSVTIEQFGLGSLGAIMGIHEFGATVGAACGPLLSGWIFDITGSYFLAFLISAGVGFLGLIMSFLLKPPGKKT